ncbi:Transglycosylase-associated protein [Collimonas fungivorans Ter331]|uniref:Transglycosylase-associated protein n=2 Tax=Collimonas fungivorans TaxID=158899 RepID=G0AJV4_COLFT|nr:Transglycosylase-associated protein [Collimonas fungivorans Ter331]
MDGGSQAARQPPRKQHQLLGAAMGILWTIIVGFVVGVIAKFLHPGKENMGFIVTTLLGIAGSFLAGYIGQALGWYQAGQGAGFIGSIVGALILLLIYGFVKGKAAS